MSIPTPQNVTELSALLSCARTKNERLGSIDISALNKILEHRPEDMTVTVEAGMTLSTLQNSLRTKGQWLPIDPPGAETLTIGELLAQNRSGPRRFGFGTIRDWLIGIRVALADGTLIRSGGKVVKNVAGYDLMKVFVGSHSSLGITVEATFKLRPLPESEQFIEVQCDTLENANRFIERINDSAVCPSVLDLHRYSAGPATLVVGFSGSAEEVAWQIDQCKALGISAASSLSYSDVFWNNGKAESLSVLPSKLTEVLGSIESPFLARAGNGLIYHRDATKKKATDSSNAALMRTLKNTFDSHQTLPDFPFAK